jgi:hypothetical protein
MSNPFNFNNPTPPAKFLGRWDLVDEIAKDLCAAQGNSHAIIAGRRCGKTSLLHALQDKLLKHLAETGSGEWHILPVLLDVMSLENKSPFHVYRGLVRELCLLTTEDKYAFAGPIFPLNLDAALIDRCYGANAPPSRLSEFKKILGHIVGEARGQYGPLRFVFLFDEVEAISEKDWANELFGNLRSLTTSPTTSAHIRLVMAGSQRFLRAQRRPGSPILNMFKRHYLQAFSDDTVCELIAWGGEFPALIIQEVIALSGGHPYIAQFLMHHLWNKRETAAVEDVRAIGRRMCMQQVDILSGWCEAVGHSGRHVFRAIAKAAEWSSPKAIRKAVSDPGVEVDEGLTALLYHNLIVQHSKGYEHRCGSELFRQWFLASRDISSQQTIMGGQDTMVSEGETQAEETYADFYVRVGPDGGIRARSDEGERPGIISLNVPSHVDLMVSLIEENKTNEKLLVDFGKVLYELIFPSSIHTHFNQTAAVARDRDQKVRIRLTIEPDALARLPWEFTYREEGGHFLAIDPKTVLSHYLDLPVPANRVRRREGPLDLLLIIANPSDQPALDPDEWDQIVTDALAGPHGEGRITIRRVKQATRRKITDALLEQQPDIVQFVGHGMYHNGKGYLALVDGNTGKTWAVDDARFAAIFLGADDRLGLVSLATCESAKSDSHWSFLGIAPQIVQRGVPAVVAMRYKVLVSTAEIFLEDFYKAVSARKPVDWAVQWARKAVALEKGIGNREFATPVLFMRAKDGNIF